MKSFFCLAFLFALFLVTSNALTVKNLERQIDLTTQLARHTLSFTIENAGSTFELPLQSQNNDLLAKISAVGKNGNDLKITKGDIRTDAGGYQVYNVQLGGNNEFSISLTFTHTMTPHPAEIEQTSPQFMKYRDNLYVFSFYPTESQRTTVKLASAVVESFTEREPVAQKGDTLEYGPFEDVPPFSREEFEVLFQNHASFLTISHVTRDFEVSHWGNLAVEEHYKIVHSGAKHVGPFSRWTHFTLTRQGQPIPAVLQLNEYLPLSANEIYYRDEIGNISSSHVSTTEDATLLELIPRYPLLGGWSINYYLGYNTPLSESVSRDYYYSSQYVLNVSLAPHIENVAIDNLEIRVILPEGARNIEVFSPRPSTQRASKLFTYLDVSGRPVQVLEFQNVVFEEGEYIQVVYQFSSFNLFFEPLLLLVGYFSLFVFAILFVRLDFLLGQGFKTQKTVRVESGLQEVKDLIEELNNQNELLDQAYEQRMSLKLTNNQYVDSKDNIKREAVTLAKRLGEIASELSQTDEALADKVKKIKTQEDARLAANLGLQHTELVERKSLKKEAYEAKKAKYAADLKAATAESARLASELSD